MIEFGFGSLIKFFVLSPCHQLSDDVSPTLLMVVMMSCDLLTDKSFNILSTQNKSFNISGTQNKEKNY